MKMHSSVTRQDLNPVPCEFLLKQSLSSVLHPLDSTLFYKSYLLIRGNACRLTR